MDKAGISSDFIAKKLAAGLKAKKSHFFSFKGRVRDVKVTEDHETQQKYFRNALEIRGDIKQTMIDNLNVGVIAIPHGSTETEWNDVQKQRENPE